MRKWFVCLTVLLLYKDARCWMGFKKYQKVLQEKFDERHVDKGILEFPAATTDQQSIKRLSEIFERISTRTMDNNLEKATTESYQKNETNSNELKNSEEISEEDWTESESSNENISDVLTENSSPSSLTKPGNLVNSSTEATNLTNEEHEVLEEVETVTEPNKSTVSTFTNSTSTESSGRRPCKCVKGVCACCSGRRFKSALDLRSDTLKALRT